MVARWSLRSKLAAFPLQLGGEPVEPIGEEAVGVGAESRHGVRMARAGPFQSPRGRKDLGLHPALGAASAVAHAPHERDLTLVGQGLSTRGSVRRGRSCVAG